MRVPPPRSKDLTEEDVMVRPPHLALRTPCLQREVTKPFVAINCKVKRITRSGVTD